MEDGEEYGWEADPTKYFNQKINEDQITKSLFRETTEKLEKIALLNELNKITQAKEAAVRFTIIVVDLSLGVQQKYFGVTRYSLLRKHLGKCILSFYQNNPLSSLAIIGTNNGSAFVLSEFSTSPGEPQRIFQTYNEFQGHPSMDNALKLCLKLFEEAPRYARKDIVIFFSSMISTDSMSIDSTICSLIKQNIVCNVITFACKIALLDQIAESTVGYCELPLDEQHFRVLCHKFISTLHIARERYPELSKKSNSASLLQLGFPSWNALGLTESVEEGNKVKVNRKPNYCACHQQLRSIGYNCPNCGALNCEIPCRCSICNILLTSSAHLVRMRDKPSLELFYNIQNPGSYGKYKTKTDIDRAIVHALMDVGIELKPEWQFARCSSCAISIEICISNSGGLNKVSICPVCKSPFCLECDLFIHETLLSCPACLVLNQIHLIIV